MIILGVTQIPETTDPFKPSTSHPCNRILYKRDRQLAFVVNYKLDPTFCKNELWCSSARRGSKSQPLITVAIGTDPQTAVSRIRPHPSGRSSPPRGGTAEIQTRSSQGPAGFEGPSLAHDAADLGNWSARSRTTHTVFDKTRKTDRPMNVKHCTEVT